ncbi:sodium/hydrogen exchanger 8-like isoform X3 [Solanum lycopersicum]|uniref:sodium/hydrogen exchanger 8-like isoform X3 n=1 Tax=Solanum lycopersicum TaxID=4081 RepID=UPI003747BC16
MSGKYSTHHVFELFPNSAIMGTVEEGTLPYNLWQGESSSSSSSSNPSDAVLFGGICLLVGVSCRTLLRRTTIPYTVVLLILGIALGSLEFGSIYRLGKLGNGIRIWADIDADLLLAVFLPILIFEGAFSMQKCMAQMLLLAGPGVLISTGLIGAAVKLIFPYDWNWNTSLLLGAILSATDPVAVVALLKDLGASKKLSTIVEGESMMNDGAAIVVYQLFYRMVLGKSSGCVAVLEYLAEGSLGSVLIGIVFGMASLLWLRFIYNDTLTDFSLALTVSYIAYYTAQEEAEASGILTLVALGMVFAMSKDTHRAGGKQSLHEFWEMIAYIANTLIFILSGVIIAQSIFSIGNLENNTGRSWGYVFLLYIILQVARTIVVFAFYPALCYFGYGLNWKEAIIIIWSGLRGAVGLALSLSIKDASGDPKYLSSETGAMFVFLTGGSVLLTLIINGSTTQLLLSLFGMDALSESEKTMVNYAKHQLLRKAEEFSRTCSGSNNPFDWITVGGYASCIKDVCEDTVWPPCTTNHGYLKIDDMKTMRVCFLKATRETYWSTFNEGRITESSISVLMESIDEAIDLATQGLHDWNYISTHLKFPGYYRFFSTSVCPPRLTRWLVLKKLQDSCHICSAFIHAHRIARQLLLDYTGKSDNGNAAIVVAESEVEEIEARKFLENVKNSMPEIIHQTESREVTFSLLKCLDECLSDMEKDGILTEKVVLHVHDLLQNDLEKLLRSPPTVRIPKPVEVLSIHPLLANLSPAIQSDLECSANSVLKTPGCTLYTKGSKLTSVWLIGNGSVRSRRSPFPINCHVDSTYHRGSVLGLYEALVGKPYLSDMVTDSVAFCVKIKLEWVISVLARDNAVEELLWKECTVVVSKLLAPDIFKKFSMQEVRSIIDERSVMNTFSSQEVIETSHHSINFLLSGCLRDQSTEQLIECPAVLPCSILSESIPYSSANGTAESFGSCSYSKYKVVKPARIVRIDISAV